MTYFLNRLLELLLDERVKVALWGLHADSKSVLLPYSKLSMVVCALAITTNTQVHSMLTHRDFLVAFIFRQVVERRTTYVRQFGDQAWSSQTKKHSREAIKESMKGPENRPFCPTCHCHRGLRLRLVPMHATARSTNR